MKRSYVPLLVAAVGLMVLPFALDLLGLTLSTSTDVVIFAIACLGLNILVGNTGLVSFGHGAFFGLATYAAALSQRHWFPGEIVFPALFAVLFVGISAALAGYLILRRRGVYFSLLTLALTAMLFAIAYRWTAFTGGESGLGGVVRPAVFGLNLDRPWVYYWTVAAIGFAVTVLLWRFHHSPVGRVLVAIRENEQRARFIGYPTDRYKLLAFTASATITAIAGVLSVFHHRFASADPLSVTFSGELLAMVVIGGMRSFLGPALGALFFILFRELLSIWTPLWLFWFGLLFVGFIVFSPTGLVGVAEELIAPWRRKVTEAAAMAGRTIAVGLKLPPSVVRHDPVEGPVLAVSDVLKSFGGIRAVRGVSFSVRDRTLHALIGPNGAGKTTAFNLVSGMFAPDLGRIELGGRPISGLKPEAITSAGVGRSFQITNLFAGLSVQENVRLAVQARHRHRFAVWRAADSLIDVTAETAELMAYLGLAGIERAADMSQDPDRRRDIPVGETGQGVAPDAAGDCFDLVGDGAAACRQKDDLGAAVVLSLLAADQAGRLEVVQQANDRGTVERHRRRQILLPRCFRRTSDMDERQPGRLGQVERLQADIRGAAPLAGGPRQQGAKGIAIGRSAVGHGHNR